MAESAESKPVSVEGMDVVPGQTALPAESGLKKLVDPAMHSAEHILTATLMKLFKCGRPVTTHIEKKKSKADYRFDRNLTSDELARVEREVNGVIESDLRISDELLTVDQAKSIYDLHRLPPGHDQQIRVVHVGEYDACPCSGPHAASTGALGRFRIVSSSFDQGILRVRFKLDPIPSHP
jgi:misacylated tRNA(Ala) deacylase